MLHMTSSNEIDELASIETLIGYVESLHKDEVLKGAQLISTQIRKYYEDIIDKLEREN